MEEQILGPHPTLPESVLCVFRSPQGLLTKLLQERAPRDHGLNKADATFSPDRLVVARLVGVSDLGSPSWTQDPRILLLCRPLR